MATDTIPADLPPMMEFKAKADKIIKERYGIEVEHLHAKISYEEQFYCKHVRGKYIGSYYGFPISKKANGTGAWCNDRLKLKPMIKPSKNQTIYLGIACDEPKSPLVEYDIPEAMARERAEKLSLLSPIYTQSARGGCWFCHNQGLQQLRLLRHQYPEYWALMLKWDNDSPVTFKPDGTTVHMLDERFANEDAQLKFF